MLLVNAPPAILQKVYPQLIWKIPTDKKEIYLTFDDGPIPDVTPWVLDELKKFKAKATFFCIGDNVWRNPKEFGKVLISGNSIGNHTFRHLDGWKSKTANYIQDVRQCAEFVPSKLFRPPYGRIKPSQIKCLKKDFKIIMWNVLSYDYKKNVNKDKCLKNILRTAKAGSIIVFHDSLKASDKLTYLLPRVLDHFSNKEFEFKAIQIK